MYISKSPLSCVDAFVMRVCPKNTRTCQNRCGIWVIIYSIAIYVKLIFPLFYNYLDRGFLFHPNAPLMLCAEDWTQSMGASCGRTDGDYCLMPPQMVANFPLGETARMVLKPLSAICSISFSSTATLKMATSSILPPKKSVWSPRFPIRTFSGSP